MKRSDVISNHNIAPGDVIVGLASSGRTAWENEYNSGIGSNGLTSARHDMFAGYLAKAFPESYDPAVPEKLVYTGSYRLTDMIEETGLGALLGRGPAQGSQFHQ
jgi:phosphoribosylformylglycinamidine cyclo-ligase